MTGKILHVCGTTGSGKTTLIRGWMNNRTWEPLTEPGDKIRGYLSGQLHVMGPYIEGLQTSGCDAMKDTPVNYRLIEESWRAGRTVVYEGLFMMNHTRGLALWSATRAVSVLRLTTSLDEARAGVVVRRAAQGNHDPLPPRFEDTLIDNDKRATNYAWKMKQAGAPVYKVSRDEALGKLRELTGE